MRERKAQLASLGACALALGAAGCRALESAPAQPASASSSSASSSGASSAAPAGAEAGNGAVAPSTPAATQGSTAPARASSPVHGSLSTRYRARWEGGDDDQDFDTVLALDVGDARQDRVTGHLTARASADLDGGTSGDPFFGLQDTYDHDVTARLYYAWADYRPDPAKKSLVERVRVGRQIDHFTPELAWFDGASAETRPAGKANVQVGLYGGVPVHLYESSADGDALFGVFAAAEPWKRGRVRADWMHLEDETRLAEHENDLFSLEAQQTLSPALRVDGKYTHLEEEPRDVRAQASWLALESGTTVFLSYYELLRTQKSFALDVDPFFTTLLEQFPYRQARLLASKSVGDSLLFQGGADVRRVSDDADIGQFNRDFERVFLTGTLAEPLPWKLSLSLTGEVWNSPDSDIETWGADLSRRFDPRIDVALGSYYALFKYDLFSVDERDDVRTYYVSVRWRRTKAGSFDARYEFEDSEFGEFQTLRLGAQWQF